MNAERITLIGAPPSPYTRKMISLLRYRHIKYEIIWGDPGTILDSDEIFTKLNIEKPKPALLPTFILPNKEGNMKAVTDSTPIIRRFEKEYSERSVIPKNPVLSFLNFLLEDFGDEWATKYMFHYRWHFKEDAKNAASLLPLNHNASLPDDHWKQFSNYIGPRQIERLWVVGSNEKTAPVIEDSYKRFLAIMEKHLACTQFILGEKPSSADFAIFGQLTQLIGFDPTSRNIAHEISKRTVAWINSMEDLSGLKTENKEWLDVDSIPSSLKDLLAEVGKVYAPALIANARALENGDETWETEIDGVNWSQKAFPYQAKCLKWIREEFEILSEGDRAKVLEILDGSGCERLLKS